MAKGRLARLAQVRAPESYGEQERELQLALSRILTAYHRQGRSAVILLEGWDAAGKGGLIKRVTAELDPRYCAVWPIAAPDEQERRAHYLARFWWRLPEDGHWSIFDRSWYGRVTVERIEGFAGPAEWKRAYAEINEFEKLLTDDGARIVKLFLHISQKEQDERLVDRLQQPWKRWKVNADDFRNRSRREDYIEAYEEMFERTDKPNAPWHVIGADHKKAARIAGMETIVRELSRDVDLSDPPLDPALRELAERALDLKLKLPKD